MSDWDEAHRKGISARQTADSEWANKAKADEAKRKHEHGANGPTQSDYSPEDDARPPAFTDEALALRFAEKHADRLRYVAGWSKWHIWTGTHWRQDNTLNAFDDARKICRTASAECNKDKIKKAIASAKTVAAVYSLARADRRLAATVDQWDSDNWLLNTPNGTVDLHTGKQRPHRTNDYITKLTGVSPDPSCPVTLWRSVLDRVTGGDQDLIDYLQRLFGYALTGSTREHSLHFAHGLGANGKTTVLNAITGCMGDYHRTAPIETFTVTSLDRHPTDLAMLRGARLVTATETEEGRKWAESRIKQLGGTTMVRAYITSAVAGAFLLGTATAALAVTGEFSNMCTMGLASGKDIQTDCTINAQLQGKTYCFGSKEAMTQFMADPSGNMAKAQAYYSKKHPG